MLRKSRGFDLCHQADDGVENTQPAAPSPGPVCLQLTGPSRSMEDEGIRIGTFFPNQRRDADNKEMQNQTVHGTSKASACLRVRRYKHPLISLQFPHAEITCLLRLMSTKMIF